MPQLNDTVEVVFTTPGGPFVFNGLISRVHPQEVEVTGPWAGPVPAPISALEAVGPNAWRVEFTVSTKP